MRKRARVLQEAARLGYKPSHIARSLSQGTTNTVALMKSVADVSGFDETFFMTIADGLQLSLSEKNLDLILLVCGSNLSKLDAIFCTILAAGI